MNKLQELGFREHKIKKDLYYKVLENGTWIYADYRKEEPNYYATKNREFMSNEEVDKLPTIIELKKGKRPEQQKVRSYTKEEMYQIISKKSGETIQETKERVEAKRKELSGLISEEGAIHVIANQYNIDLMKGMIQWLR